MSWPSIYLAAASVPTVSFTSAPMCTFIPCHTPHVSLGLLFQISHVYAIHAASAFTLYLISLQSISLHKKMAGKKHSGRSTTHSALEGICKELCWVHAHSSWICIAFRPPQQLPRIHGCLLHREAEAEADDGQFMLLYTTAQRQTACFITNPFIFCE